MRLTIRIECHDREGGRKEREDEREISEVAGGTLPKRGSRDVVQGWLLQWWVMKVRRYDMARLWERKNRDLMDMDLW